MAFNINEMRAHLKAGGARNTLFQVQLNNPVNGDADFKTPFLIQAASLPEWTLGVIRVPYMGRVVHLPGDRVFSPWNVEVINDEDFHIRDRLETWNNKIQTLEGNIRDLPSAESIHFTSQATVTQLGKTGNILRVYEFTNVWPSNIGAIELGWSAGDQIEVFPTTFVHDGYKVAGGITGNAGGT